MNGGHSENVKEQERVNPKRKTSGKCGNSKSFLKSGHLTVGRERIVELGKNREIKSRKNDESISAHLTVEVVRFDKSLNQSRRLRHVLLRLPPVPPASLMLRYFREKPLDDGAEKR